MACSEDAQYPEAFPAFMRVLREHGCTARVFIAGNPAEHVDALSAAGAEGFIHVRSDLGAELEAIISSLNIDLL